MAFEKNLLSNMKLEHYVIKLMYNKQFFVFY